MENDNKLHLLRLLKVIRPHLIGLDMETQKSLIDDPHTHTFIHQDNAWLKGNWILFMPSYTALCLF